MPTTSINPDTTLAQLLLTAPELRPVWERLGVNPVRDEGRTLTELCESRGLESRTVARLLSAMKAARQEAPAACVELMTLGQLCDHLEDAHRNLRDELKQLDQLTKVLAKGEAAQHPRRLAIRKRFVAFQRQFKAHLRKESESLFPVVRRWAASQKETRQSLALVNPPLAQLVREHSQADEALADLRFLVAGSPPSSAAPAAVRSVADAIARLERTVREQIYKENHMLFPRALPMQPAAQSRHSLSRGRSCPGAITLLRTNSNQQGNGKTQ